MKGPVKKNRGYVEGFSRRPFKQGHRIARVRNKEPPCYFSRCQTTVFEEKCLASEPFVKEHVDVNVHLPQMFTELLLNKLFVPYLCLSWFALSSWISFLLCSMRVQLPSVIIVLCKNTRLCLTP